MNYEPRSRGIRSRRIATKKPASREGKNSGGQEFYYKETVQVNPQEVISRVMNELEHLGTQRFGMPPFSEHFQRWMLDVESVLDAFRTALPELVNEGFETALASVISGIQRSLTERVNAEKAHADEVGRLQGQLSSIEREIATLESEHKIKMNSLRRSSENTVRKIRSEINALGSQRLKLVRAKPTLLERIMGSAKVRIDSNARSLQSKQSVLQKKETDFRRRLDALKSDYEDKRKPLVAERDEIREDLTTLQSAIMDDALEIRKNACEELRKKLSNLTAPLLQRQDQGSSQ